MCQAVTDMDDFYMSDCWLDFVPTNNFSQKDPAPKKNQENGSPQKQQKSNFLFEEVVKVENTNETMAVDIKSEADDTDMESSTDIPLYVSQRLRARKKKKSSNISYAALFGKFKKDKLKIKSAKKKSCFETEEGRSNINSENMDALLLCKSQEGVDVSNPVAFPNESEEDLIQGEFTDDSSSEISPSKDDTTNFDKALLNASEHNVSNTKSLDICTRFSKESPKEVIKLEENHLLEIDSTASEGLEKLSKSEVAKNESFSDDGATPSTEFLEDSSKSRVACALCEKSYKYSSDLTKHMKKMPAGCDLNDFLRAQTADLSCKICNKQFSCRKNLNGHMSIHTLEKKLVHECELCNKGFSKAELLLNHVYEHTGVKSHSCETCGKQYTKMANLWIHVRVAHMQESDHSCPICDRKFSRIEHLKNHMAMHTGLKKHVCGTCGKKYTQVGNLQRHERVHTGNRPFLCQYCGTSFTQKTILIDHLAAVHSQGDIKQCHVCSKYFSHISRLRKHLCEEHGQRAIDDNGQHMDNDGQQVVLDNKQRVEENGQHLDNGQHINDNSGVDT